jgi:hyperosmotically inducible periplasmic protein
MKPFLYIGALTLTLAPLAAPGWAGDSPTTPGYGSYDADNTGRNVRDLKPTAGEQSNDAADVRVTREIRRAIVDDDSLSTNAHNVKIITSDGVVTLRGPVDSSQERQTIAAKAQKVTGVKRIDNQLEVTKD